MLDTLSAGRFPDDPDGHRIAALAARSGAKTGERIREYWEVLTRLVLTSEETLLQQSADADRVEVDIGAELYPPRRIEARAWPQHDGGAQLRCCRSAATIIGSCRSFASG